MYMILEGSHWWRWPIRGNDNKYHQDIRYQRGWRFSFKVKWWSLHLHLNKAKCSKRVRENLKVIDTGSQGNVPNECSVKCIQEKSTLPGVPQRNAVKNRHVVLTAYNGTKIPQYGAIQLQCRYNGCKWINIDFYVVDSEGPAILGLPSSLDHKLVTLDCEMRESNEESRPTESRHGMSKPKDNSRRVNKTCHHLPS